MKERKIIFWKAAVAITIALAFILPGSAAFANFGTVGVTSNGGTTGDGKKVVESTNGDAFNSIEKSNVDSTEKNNADVPLASTIDNNIDLYRGNTKVLPQTRGGTIYVDDNRPPEWYDATHVKTIQKGINNATAGDTVYVYNGTYAERVKVNKTVNLVGESRENVIVDGTGTTGHVFYVNVSRVNISTFTVVNGGYGIYLFFSSNSTVTNCKVYNTTQAGSGYGIQTWYSPNCTIANCEVYNTLLGILTSWSKNCNILDCNVYNTGISGNGIGYFSNNNVINCSVYNTGYGIAPLSTCSNSNVINCKIYNNFYGIFVRGLKQVNNCITNCNVYNNSWGLRIWDSTNIKIENCKVYNNSGWAISIEGSSSGCYLRGNRIYNNSLNLYVGSGSTISTISDFYQDIDFSNKINGKRIYYLVEQENIILDETYNFGYLGLISCTNITAKNSDVWGLLLVNTSDSTISNVSFHNDGTGILLYSSSNCNIMNCDVNNTATLYGDNGYNIEIRYSSNCNITNCSLSTARSGITGIYLAGSQNNKITNCNFHKNKYGIYLTTAASNNNITNCNFYENEYGIYLTGSQNNNIINCRLYDNHYSIYLKSSPDCYLRGNSIYDNDFNFYVEGGSNHDFYQDIDTSNTINGKPIYYLVEQSDYEFNETHSLGYLGLVSCTRITVKNLDICGMLLVNTPNLAISNVSSHGGSSGIYLYSCSNCNISNCDLYNNVYGIYLTGSQNCNIINCNLYNNSMGIYLTGSSNNNIINCDAYNNGFYGIYLSGSPSNKIINCTSRNNPYGNIYLTASSANNNIIHCDAYNSQYGIYLSGSQSNKIINCTLYNNQNGIYLTTAASNNNIIYCDIYNNSLYGIYSATKIVGNVIHHNNFVNVPMNAYARTLTICDNGYPSGGNYWSDYIGSDNFSGPGQNISGSDGIGDTPYNITGMTPPNKDRYPLMTPILSAPELLSPVNGSHIDNHMPTFDWGDCVPIYEVRYTLLVATDIGFTSMVINQTSLEESEYTPPTNMSFDTYYWKVRAIVGNYTTNWSETWNVTIELDLTPPTTPDLIEPANNSMLQIPPTIFFNWTDAYDRYGIDYYTFQIATDRYFANIVFNVTSADSEYTVTLLTSGSYYWRVRAVDNNGLIGSWSEVWRFVRGIDTNSPEVELLYPIGGEYLRGEVIILWNATDDYTPDIDLPITIKYRCGGSWQILASDEINDGAYLWNTTGYPDSTIYIIRISTEDYWGNMGSDESYTTFTVDNTAPETTAYLDPATPDGENNWYVSNVRITLITENKVRSLNSDTISIDTEDTYTMYKIDDGNWQKYFVPFTVSENGDHTVKFYSVDKAGNIEPTATVSFNIDKTAPQFTDYTFTPLNVLKTKWLCVATVTDATSGIVLVEFYVDGILVGNDTTAPYEFQYNGKPTTSSQAIAYDAAGNSAMSPIVSSLEYTPNSQQQNNNYSSMQILKQMLLYRQTHNTE